MYRTGVFSITHGGNPPLMASTKKGGKLAHETEKSRGKLGSPLAEPWYPNNIPRTSFSPLLGLLFFMLVLFPGSLFPHHGKQSPSASGLHGPKSAVSVEGFSDLEYADEITHEDD